MTWSTSEIKYEGLPLLLRRPDHSKIWEFTQRFNRLVSVEQTLEKVTNNGLPEKSYNETLAEFDHHMCSLLDDTDTGIPILVETFSGKRNYYYYTSPDFAIDQLVKETENNFKVKLRVRSKLDNEWNFIKTYPVRLYSK